MARVIRPDLEPRWNRRHLESGWPRGLPQGSLVEGFGRDPDPVADIGELEFPEELEEGRLVKSHRALCLSVSSFSRFSLTIPRWLARVHDADDPAGNSTTPGDVTVQKPEEVAGALRRR